jgi:hypothetical protein
MWLTVASGKLELLPSSVVCELCDGERRVTCAIAHHVLLDIGSYHGGRATTAVAIFSELLPEIVRLATAKCAAGQIDGDGILRLGSVDLVRFGFGDRSRNTSNYPRAAA